MYAFVKVLYKKGPVISNNLDKKKVYSTWTSGIFFTIIHNPVAYVCYGIDHGLREQVCIVLQLAFSVPIESVQVSLNIW